MTKNSKKSVEELRATFSQADKLLETARKDLDFVKDFISRLAEIDKNLNRLMVFYQDQSWVEGREELFRLLPDENFESAGEDSIWDVSQQFYFLKIKLMKQLADDFHTIIPDYYHEILEQKDGRDK